MKYIKSCFSSFLLLMFISFVFHTQLQAEMPDSFIQPKKHKRVSAEVIKKLDKINKVENLFAYHLDDLPSMDEIFQLMESLMFSKEEDSESLYTYDELGIIITYVIKMARMGVSPENKEKLEKDIEKLLSTYGKEEDTEEDEEIKNDQNCFFSYSKYSNKNNYIISSSRYDNWNIVLCSNPIKKAGKNTKKAVKKTAKAVKKAAKETAKAVKKVAKDTSEFVKDNAKTIAIVGAAVVVAGVTTYCIVSSKSSKSPDQAPEKKDSNPIPSKNTENISYQDSPLSYDNDIENPFLKGPEINIYTFEQDSEEKNVNNNPFLQGLPFAPQYSNLNILPQNKDLESKNNSYGYSDFISSDQAFINNVNKIIENSELSQIFDNNITDFYQHIQNDQNTEHLSSEDSLSQDTTKLTIKDLGSYFSHKVLDEVSDYTKFVPELIDEMGEICSRFVPDELINDTKDNSLCKNLENGAKKKFEEAVIDGHNKIDDLFDTDLSELYTKEAKENKDKDWSIAFLPPPGRLLKSAKSLSSIKTQKDILNIIKPNGKWIGKEGTNSYVRIFEGGPKEAEQIFNELTKNGRIYYQDMEKIICELSEEIYITYRSISLSGPSTIDIKMEGLRNNIKLKFIEKK